MGYFSEADIDIRMPKTDDGDGVKEINFFAAMAEIDSPIKVAESTPSEQKHVEQKPKEIKKEEIPVAEPKEPPVETAPKAPETAPHSPAKPSVKETSEDQKRKEHEEAEAKRKAEWEAKKKAKEDAEILKWQNTVASIDGSIAETAKKRLGDEFERLTQYNIKQCITEMLQARCLEDEAFARQVYHPRKSMLNCFNYVMRRGNEFLLQEMKIKGIKPSREGYGGAIPEGVVYEWAREYFFDMDAPEDKDENEEEFVPKPYVGKPVSKSTKKTEKKVEKKTEKTPEKKPEPIKETHKPNPLDNEGQLDLFSMLGGDFAA